MAVTLSTPLPDELEISLFGPGVGESLCIHVGEGKWIIVDSCKNPETSRPACLEYLEAMGVDPAISVEVIVITHWHSDHIGGMAEVVAASKRARIVLSSALMESELVELRNLVEAYPLPTNIESGLSEYSAILNILLERLAQRRNDGFEPYPLEFANGNQRLMETESGVVVMTLSPSAAAVVESKIGIRAIQGRQTRYRGVIPPPTQNLNAIALWLEGPTFSALLGSDLEVHSHPDVGWHAVVHSPGRPQGHAEVIKIPHHGSQTGHHGPMWDTMLTREPLGIVTQFRKSHLPRQSDLERLTRSCGSLYMTTIRSEKPTRRVKVVERFMEATAKKRTSYPPTLGHIQLRVDRAGNRNLGLNSAAVQLK